MEYEANRRVEASVRTFAIVEHLSRVDAAGVSALAAELDMSKGIVHNHLSTLRELGYVTKVGERYRLSPKLLAVGIRGRSNAPLYRFATDLVDTFTDQFDVGVVVCQRAGGDCIVIDARGAPRTVDIDVGTVLPLYESLVGLTMAIEDATIEVDSVDQYDVDSVRRSLERTGYALDRLSTTLAPDCIAVPVLDGDGTTRGCIGVVLPDALGNRRRHRIGEAAISLRERIEDRFDGGWTDERSFATEKHAWID